MALIVGGTTVTGTNIPVVGIGVVGSFAFCRTGSAFSGGSGSTQSASLMKWTNGNGFNGGNTNLSGTWRVHGVTESGQVHGTVWQRIS